MSMQSQIWPVMMLAVGLALVGASRADESSKNSAAPDATSDPGMMEMPAMPGTKDMMGMMGMMGGCERMMQMSERHPDLPNQQWRQDGQVQPESR